MKRDDIYWGNEICCATYGFLNAVQDREIDYKLFELTTTVPFGIKHQREKDFSRLLTTYCDPNIGMDRAIGLWGYRQEKKLFVDSKEAAKYIAEKSKTSRCLVGPIDMGRLNYLMLSNLYINMDHYVTVYQIEGQMFCMDSEGILVRKITEEEMQVWFQVNELPEAKGCIAVRSFEKVAEGAKVLREEEDVKSFNDWIRKNLIEAKGRLAIEQCFQWLLENPMDRWKLSFLYDISYLIQRKILQIYWTRYAVKFFIRKEDRICEIKETIQEQIQILQMMFKLLQRENRVSEIQFHRLAELEEQFTFDILKRK